MKVEVLFALVRSQASINAANAILADWGWPEKTIAAMAADRAALKTQADHTDTLSVAFDAAHANRVAAFNLYHTTTVALLGMTKTHFRKDPAATAQLKPLRARGQNEQDILDEGDLFAKVWEQLDATYIPDTGWPLAAFQAAGADCLTKQDAENTAGVVWNNEVKNTDVMAADVQDTNIAWYADATRKFGPDTAHGQMIRSTVPTTSKAQAVPQVPVIGDALALGGGKVHLDFHVVGASSVRVLDKPPGAATFTTLADTVTGDSFDGSGLVPGAHLFEIVGVNSAGDGPVSADIALAVT